MTKKQKWNILKALPPLDDATWYKLVAVLDAMIAKERTAGWYT